MCGITGILNRDQSKPDELLLKKMTESIIHRGPDDGGVEIIGRCGLGNRRLAIIDISPAGHMPMWDNDGKVCITYNGEVYNYQQLKKDLLVKKYRFHSNSDTEVILNLYKEYGEGFVSKLRGMFALAIWDKENQKLILTCDHFGVKPLHYYVDDKVLVFGSEIKSILLHPAVKREINPIALSHYFSLGFGCVAAPETIFKGIRKLEPASILVAEKGNIKVKKYWDLTQVKSNKIEFNEARQKVLQLLESSVKNQLISDVPLGSFLSGGIDSSLITALAQRNTKHNIKTFSIGFTDKKFDESDYALQVTKHLSTDHYHQQFTAKELLNILPEVVEKLDEPLADASILPTYLLSKFTREKVTVSLSGDGGDEIFAGYPTYLAHQYALLINWLPDKLKPMIKKLVKTTKFLPIFKHAGHLSADYKIDRFIDGMSLDKAKQYLNFMGPCNLNLKANLINQSEDYALEHVNNLINQSESWGKQKQLQYLDFMIYMGQDCLTKTDRASSFNSLEVRPPFLDVELVEYAFSLPSNYMLRGNTLKYILKKSAEGILPDNIINRPKKGFGIPTGEWLSNELRSQVESLLNKKKMKKEGIFDENLVEQVMQEHFSGKQNHRMLLWNLFMFELWWEKWRE